MPLFRRLVVAANPLPLRRSGCGDPASRPAGPRAAAAGGRVSTAVCGGDS